MDFTVMSAVGGLIEQQTKAQLMRDWEGGPVDKRSARDFAAQIVAFFGRLAGVAKMNFDAGAAREARV